jgi:hypothetical protein
MPFQERRETVRLNTFSGNDVSRSARVRTGTAPFGRQGVLELVVTMPAQDA